MPEASYGIINFIEQLKEIEGESVGDCTGFVATDDIIWKAVYAMEQEWGNTDKTKKGNIHHKMFRRIGFFFTIWKKTEGQAEKTKGRG